MMVVALQLRQELEDHAGMINSICFSDDGEKMFSADSMGVIIIWNSFFSENPAKRGEWVQTPNDFC